ncbi:MAG: hypothetical protein J3Q66DRAFT_334438 [Benniella sp.]|nr:MAG: hypothetical protein J3Q66DRAFT_334438 [Benniella sp.]
MNTPGSLPNDRTGAPHSGVRASVSQINTHSCPDPASWPNPNNHVRSARTSDETSLGSCANGPDGTLHFSPPTEPDSPVLQQFYQVHPSLQPSQLVPILLHLTRLQLLLERSQQREEQLQLQLIHRNQWLQQFQQQQQQRQQQLPEQLVTLQNIPPFRELLPMNNGPTTSMHPWMSEVMCEWSMESVNIAF